MYRHIELGIERNEQNHYNLITGARNQGSLEGPKTSDAMMYEKGAPFSSEV